MFMDIGEKEMTDLELLKREEEYLLARQIIFEDPGLEAVAGP